MKAGKEYVDHIISGKEADAQRIDRAIALLQVGQERSGTRAEGHDAGEVESGNGHP